MKNITFAILLSIFTFAILSVACNKDVELEPIIRIKEYKNTGSIYDAYKGVRTFYYENNQYKNIIINNDTNDYRNNIMFFYKNNRIDYYKGAMWGSCCDAYLKKNYFYNSNGLIDSIMFESTYKDDVYEKILLKRDSKKRINYYEFRHSLDPTPIFHYKWVGDNIKEKKAEWYDCYYSPQTTISTISTYEYTNIENPLRGLNTLFFDSKFLNKNLVKKERRIEFKYEIDNTLYTKTLIGTDTIDIEYHYDIQDSKVLKIYAGSVLMDEISYYVVY